MSSASHDTVNGSSTKQSSNNPSIPIIPIKVCERIISMVAQWKDRFDSREQQDRTENLRACALGLSLDLLEQWTQNLSLSVSLQHCSMFLWLVLPPPSSLLGMTSLLTFKGSCSMLDSWLCLNGSPLSYLSYPEWATMQGCCHVSRGMYTLWLSSILLLCATSAILVNPCPRLLLIPLDRVSPHMPIEGYSPKLRYH